MLFSCDVTKWRSCFNSEHVFLCRVSFPKPFWPYNFLLFHWSQNCKIVETKYLGNLKQVNVVPLRSSPICVIYYTIFVLFSFIMSTLKGGNIANAIRKSFRWAKKVFRISIESSFFSEKVGSLFGKRSLILRAVRFAKKSNTLLVDFLDRTTRT